MKATLGRINVTRILPIILATPIILIITFFLATQNHFLAAGSDFLSYFTGASIIKNGKADLIYDISTQRKYFEDIIYPLKGTVTNRFISPPFVALFFLPFTFINFYSSYKIFLIVNLGIFLVFLHLLAKTFPAFFKKYNFLYILPFYFFPVAVTLFMGQTSFVLAIIFLLIYLSLLSNKPKDVGVLTAALLFKPQYVFAIPFLLLLIKKKKQFLLWFFITTLSLLLISLFLVGPKALFDYFPFILSTENPDFGNRAQQMFSLHATLSHLIFASKLSNFYPFLLNSGVYLLFLYLFKKRMPKMTKKTSFIFVILSTLIFSLHVLNHDLVLLILPILILLEKGRLIAPLLIFILPSISILGNTLIATLVLLFIASFILFKPRA